MAVVCNGSSTCSQIAEAASAKAKPAPPAAKAPRNAPIQTTSKLATERPAIMAACATRSRACFKPLQLPGRSATSLKNKSFQLAGATGSAPTRCMNVQ